MAWGPREHSSCASAENLGLPSARTRGAPLGAGGASESVLLVSRATRRRAGARGPWFEDFLAAPVSRHLSVGPGVPLHILRGRCIFFIYRKALQGLARAPIRGCCFSSWLVAAHAAPT